VKYITIIILAIALFAGCTKTNEPPIHPSDWAERDSENFHATKVNTTGIGSCSECHKNDFAYDFDNADDVSCFPCHAEGHSPHPIVENWVESSASTDFHGKFIQGNGSESCRQCHSNAKGNFRGGTSGISCYQCHAGGPNGHPAYEFWMGPPANDQFHGKVASSRGVDTCQACHGQDLDGGVARYSCFICHSVISF